LEGEVISPERNPKTRLKPKSGMGLNSIENKRPLMLFLNEIDWIFECGG